MPVGHLNVFFGELFRSAHFLIGFFFTLRCSCCLCILVINPLSVTFFANIFFHLWVVFSFDYGFLCCSKAFKFNWVSFVYFVYITLGDRYKNTLVWFMSQSVLLLLFSRRFIVSSLTFRTLVHFEFIFVCGVTKCSHFRHIAAQFSLPHLLKRLCFLHCIFLPPLL